MTPIPFHEKKPGNWGFCFLASIIILSTSGATTSFPAFTFPRTALVPFSLVCSVRYPIPILRWATNGHYSADDLYGTDLLVFGWMYPCLLAFACLSKPFSGCFPNPASFLHHLLSFSVVMDRLSSSCLLCSTQWLCSVVPRSRYPMRLRSPMQAHH